MVDLSIREPENKQAIRVTVGAEARWWARELEADLGLVERAVDAVGTDPGKVKKWIAAAKAEEVAYQRRREQARRLRAEKIAELRAEKAAGGKAKAGASLGVAAAGGTAMPAAKAPPVRGAGAGDADPPAAPTAKEPQDKSTIDPKDEDGLLWWSQNLGIDVPRIKELVVTIGADPRQVREYLDARERWEKANNKERRRYETYQASAAARAPAPTEAQSMGSRLKGFVKGLFGSSDAAIDDSNRIFIADPENARFWAGELGIELRELQELVVTVGNNANKVRVYLTLRRRWRSLTGKQQDAAVPARPRRHLLPARIREPWLRFNRRKEAWLDRHVRSLPIAKLPFIRNKWAMRALGVFVTGLSFQYFTGQEEAARGPETRSAYEQQLRGVDLEGMDPEEAKALAEQWENDAAALQKGELPGKAQRIVEETKARLRQAQLEQDARRRAIEGISKDR